jgi:hypothetical protein
MITAQLILSGTPLIRLNGTISKTEATIETPPAEVLVMDPTAKKKTTKQIKIGLEPDAVEETTVTIEELRSDIQAKAKAGKRDDIKKLLKEFGAASVTELDEEHYGDFKLKLDRL